MLILLPSTWKVDGALLICSSERGFFCSDGLLLIVWLAFRFISVFVLLYSRTALLLWPVISDISCSSWPSSYNLVAANLSSRFWNRFQVKGIFWPFFWAEKYKTLNNMFGINSKNLLSLPLSRFFFIYLYMPIPSVVVVDWCLFYSFLKLFCNKLRL